MGARPEKGSTARGPQICVKWNREGVSAVCALCHQDILVGKGPAFFVDGENVFACSDCSKRLAPELLDVLQRFYASEGTPGYLGDDGMTGLIVRPNVPEETDAELTEIDDDEDDDKLT